MQKGYLEKLFSPEGKAAMVTGEGRGTGQIIARDLTRPEGTDRRCHLALQRISGLYQRLRPGH